MRSLPYPGTLFVLLLAPLLTQPAAGQANTFTVTTEDEAPEHPYFEEGFSTKFVIDGAQDTELILEKGAEYHFQMDGVPSFHPFYLTTSAIGVGSDPYDDGVDGNGAHTNQVLTFTPPSDAPDSLWYQCTNHQKMGWRMALVEDSSRASVASDGAVLFDGTGVTVNFSGTSGSAPVTVDKFNSAPDGADGISESTVSEYRFVIEAGEDLSFDANTEVRFDVSSLLGVNDAGNVTVYKRTAVGSGSFAALSTDYDSEANELVATTESFSEFILASDSEGLPVELATLDAQTNGATVELSWQTLSEQNNAGFEVQRKVLPSPGEENSWSALGFVESKAAGGTTTEPIRYQFRDASFPFETERVAYRLKQVDTDGASHFSDAATVQLDGPDQLALHSPYPNPARQQTSIRYELPRTTEVQLRLYNALGQQVATLVDGRQPAGRTEIQFEVPELASGTYLVRLSADGQTQAQTLTLLR